MKSRIIKAINEGIDKALIQFDNDEIDVFSKSSAVNTINHERIIANTIVDDCIKRNSMYTKQYNQIVKDAYYPVKDKQLLKDLCKITMECGGPECDLNWIDTSQITDMSFLFDMVSYKKFWRFNGDISSWDVSNVTDMANMFYGCMEFNRNLSEWDMHNVVDTSWMFGDCRSFNQPLNDWNLRHVTNMNNMFNGCESFNLDISNWDVSNVTNMEGMFICCSSFNQDISNWDVSNVTNMSSMFSCCPSFNQDISQWDFSNVSNITGMFTGCVIKEEYKPIF